MSYCRGFSVYEWKKNRLKKDYGVLAKLAHAFDPPFTTLWAIYT